ncbi:MAG: cryptochrome/photolyase family protein [Acidimicrobiales bacterium]
METVWILGDQLRRDTGALAAYAPGQVRVLMVESDAKFADGRWHRQRLHFILAAMRRFAEELRLEGFSVDLRRASTLRAGLREHIAEFQPSRVVAMSPMSYDGRKMLERAGVHIVDNDQFLCSAESFAQWAGSRKSLKMEDFYRWQRVQLDLLMDGDAPAGGKWNYDAENREPPPKDGRSWPEPLFEQLDAIDEQVMLDIAERAPQAFGASPEGLWATTRAGALARLQNFIEEVLPLYGPHEDAVMQSEWKLAHSALSPYLNYWLLHLIEVVEAAHTAFQEGRIPIASAEGFIRQVIGWREYVWGLYWLWMPEYRDLNMLNAASPLPASFTGAKTEMACVSHTIASIDDRAWVHHIERLMILGNLSLTSGVNPQAVVEWMWKSFIDGAEWVMLPNVIGMALYADGGQMSTKPYASGGAYINRMSDHCSSCYFDPKKRTGEKACPFTTLYWDFLARNEPSLRSNHRLSIPMGSMRKLKDLDAVQERGTEVRVRIAEGTL